METSRNCIRILPTLLVIIIVTLFASPALTEETAGKEGGTELEYAQKLIKDGLYDVARGELGRLTGRDTPAGLRQRAFMLLGDIETAVLFARAFLVQDDMPLVRVIEEPVIPLLV